MVEIVSNHAVVRYCQHVLGIEGLDETRPAETFRQIESLGWSVDAIRVGLGKTVAEAVAAGACRLSRDGISYIIANGVLTTIHHGDPRAKQRFRRRTTRRIAYDAARLDPGPSVEEVSPWR